MGAHPSERVLRDHALAFPETHEDFPWGHRAIKVKGKVFAILGNSDDGFSLSVKLPQSRESALVFPFAEPTGYGLGKAGWISVRIAGKGKVPVELLRQWVDESYRAVAPKKLVAQIDGAPAPAAKPKKKPAAKAKAPRRAATKRKSS